MYRSPKVNQSMTDFVIKKFPCNLSSHAGLAFVGRYLKRININSLIDPASPTATLSNRIQAVCAWAGMTLTPSRTFAARPSSFALWVYSDRSLHC